MCMQGETKAQIWHINWVDNHHMIVTAKYMYEGESISNQPNLFPVEIHLFFFDVIAL